ncbi:uncharacterized protein LOC62_07G008968 [Vanrija pseudolonga]|uniref:Uncharacterized protein n=1 Tax=Vanrija pseudolonga TaxID=143232 RepID=A0AAF1BR31_9TREE|nr:hypothetical protein LOC62_07G008968 [Vanrija pseudolonga]
MSRLLPPPPAVEQVYEVTEYAPGRWVRRQVDIPAESRTWPAPLGPSSPRPPPHTPATNHTAPLDRNCYPHIFEMIVAYAPLAAYPALRATCWEMLRLCQPRLYEHIWIETRYDYSAPGNTAVDIFIPGSARVRVPGLDYAGDRDRCLGFIGAYTRAIDVDFTPRKGLMDEWLYLGALRGAIGKVPVLRRLDSPSTIKAGAPFSFRNVLTDCLESMPKFISAPFEVCFIDLGRPQPLTSGVTLMRGAYKTAVVVIRFNESGDNELRLLRYLRFMAANLVIILQPRVDLECSESCLKVLGAIGSLACGADPANPRLKTAPTVSIGPLDSFSECFPGMDKEGQKDVLNTILHEHAADEAQGYLGCSSNMSILSLSEMQAKVGAEWWPWVSTWPGQ